MLMEQIIISLKESVSAITLSVKRKLFLYTTLSSQDMDKHTDKTINRKNLRNDIITHDNNSTKIYHKLFDYGRPFIYQQ